MRSVEFLILFPLGGLILGWTIRWLYAKFRYVSVEQKAARTKKNAITEAEKEAEQVKKEILVEAQNQLLGDRRRFEAEVRSLRSELQNSEKRIQKKEDRIDKKALELDRRSSEMKSYQTTLDEKQAWLTKAEKQWQVELEKISGLTAEEAKKQLIQEMEKEAHYDALLLVNKIEQEAKFSAEKKARDILVTTIQRLAAEVTSEVTVTSVSLPNDEMKGRIIGREGRNIRTLESITGADVIIDDTPEAVVISCFNPIRKYIAKSSLELLIADGRIHPARIEEVVQRITKEVEKIIYEEGEKTLFDLGIHNVRSEAIRALGRLHFRTSYGQNVLAHSKEVSMIAGMLASEVGADISIAKRGALFHDIGKGIEGDSEGNHAESGGDLLRRLGEDPRVVNAVAAHHEDEEIISPEGILIQIADTISASRPGARRETLDSYTKRLENLEKIARDFRGVEKVFAMQAGRELRIVVNQNDIDDPQSKQLAKVIAKRIESELQYPGRIKVTIIRETRVVEYAC